MPEEETKNATEPQAKPSLNVEEVKLMAEWLKDVGETPELLTVISTRAMNLLYADYRNAYTENAALVKHINTNNDFKAMYESLKPLADMDAIAVTVAKKTIDEFEAKLKESTDVLHDLAKEFEVADEGPTENVRYAVAKYKNAGKQIDILLESVNLLKSDKRILAVLLRKQFVKLGLVIEKDKQISFEIMEEWSGELDLDFGQVTELLELMKYSYKELIETENGPKTVQNYKFVEKA